jgi:ADP-heptose:LPS heptosyltransferase
VDPQKILVIHGGALGDLVLFIPTLKLLKKRFPNAKIVLLGSPYSGQALVGLDCLDEIVLTKPKSDPITTYLKKILRLRSQKFDLLIDFHGTSRSRKQTFFIRAKYSMALRRGDIFDRLYDQTVPKCEGVHMVGEYVGLLEHFGLVVEDTDLRLELPITNEHREVARGLLADNGVTGPFVVIQPTTSGRPTHEVWPTKDFAHVAEALTRMGRQIVASSDAKGVEIISEIQAAASCSIINLAGKTDALVLGAVLEMADLFFGYNTGPMHVASAVHIPVVAIFERPGKYRPWHPKSEAPWHVLMPKEELVGEKSVFSASSITADEAISAIVRILHEHSESKC